jgi:ATP-dependent RNA helicase DDX49/DBP8
MARRPAAADDLLREYDEPEIKRRRLSAPLQDANASDGFDNSSSYLSSDEDATVHIEQENELSDGPSDYAEKISFSSRVRVVGQIKNREHVQKSKVVLGRGDSSISFASLGVSPSLAAALKSMSIKRPTPVQAGCIPPLLAGRDCIGNAKTGSGKTVSFAVPILQKLAVDPYGIFALVLTPTRELAFQISEQFAVLGAASSIRTAVVVGGMDMMTQSIELSNRPHVVIATPGRLLDHLQSSHSEWDLSRLKFLVLDEADRLLTPTFSPELSQIFSNLPKDRQTCLFTATMTPSVQAIADAPPKSGKEKPFVHLMEEAIETVSTLQQKYILVPSPVREAYLYHLLCNPPESTIPLMRTTPDTPHKPGKRDSHLSKKYAASTNKIKQPPCTIIFCNRSRTAAYLTILLKSLSIRSTPLHSRLTQKERLNSLGLFRASVVPVLISTDVGARGLDIRDVAMVINWDLPQESEEYTHRVGRTARAGKGGIAISFVTEKDERKVTDIESRIGTQLTEMSMIESSVLENLNAVSTAKRLANMELHDSNFGQREQIHQQKAASRSAMIPDTKETLVSPLS